jgi:hypothetical protein
VGIVPAFTGRGLAHLHDAWGLWRWMRELLVRGKNTIDPEVIDPGGRSVEDIPVKSDYTFFLPCRAAFRRVREIAKSDYSLRHVRPSVLPHGKTRLLLDGYSWNLILEYFSKICPENSRFIKIGREYWVLYVKTSIYFRSYLAHFFLEWKMIQTKVVEKLNIHFTFSNPVFQQIVSFMR